MADDSSVWERDYYNKTQSLLYNENGEREWT